MSLKEEKKRWEREVYEPLTKRYPERKEQFKTSSGFELPPVMLPPTTQKYLESLGFPEPLPWKVDARGLPAT